MVLKRPSVDMSVLVQRNFSAGCDQKEKSDNNVVNNVINFSPS